MYFGLGRSSICSHGSISVFTYLNQFTNRTFIYCGIYSNMENYPPYKNIQIIAAVEIHVGYSFTLKYSIIDRDIKVSLVSTYLTRQFKPDSITFHQIKKIYLLNYFIVTEKYNIIVGYIISTSYHWYKIYDGNPRYSDIIKVISSMGKAYFKTTAFQCLIDLWLSDMKQTSTHFYYNVKTNLVRKSEYMLPDMVKRVSLVIQDKDRIKIDLLKIDLVTKDTLHINISITDYSQRPPTFLCDYEGFTAYGLGSSNSFHLISNICWIDYTYRNIYSNTSKVLLILYTWYKHLKFTVNISLSVTTCKPVKINVCSLSIPCASSNNELCKEFLKETKDLSNVKSSLGYSFRELLKYSPPIKLYEIFLLFSIEKGKCVVFQFVYDVSKIVKPFHIESCSIGRFMHNRIFAPGTKVVYNISAYVKGECNWLC